jgi:hypothetical protein
VGRGVNIQFGRFKCLAPPQGPELRPTPMRPRPATPKVCGEYAFTSAAFRAICVLKCCLAALLSIDGRVS